MSAANFSGDTHRVVAVSEDTVNRNRRYYLVNREQPWNEAQDLWETLDTARRNGHTPGIAYFVVRADNDTDPRWAKAEIPHGKIASVVNGCNSTVNAAKRWASAVGVQGDQGGWIRWTSGKIIAQGWDRVATWTVHTRRIVQLPASGALPAPRWYVIGTKQDLDRIIPKPEVLA